jgi:5-methylcytosine-specific restriction endonuclease McrA
MDPYEISHFSNRALRVEIKASDGGETKSTAVMLSRIGEYDWRKLFLEDGYPSMRAYCIRELNYSREKASKRIYAARTARKLPVLFDAVADGRLNLSGVVMLATYLRPGNVDELLAAATRRTNEEIAQLIAELFPRPDLPEQLEALAPPPGAQHSARNAGDMFSAGPGPVPEHSPPAHPHSARNADDMFCAGPGPATSPDPHSARNAEARARMIPLAPQKFGFQFTGDQETHDAYERVRNLLSHEVPSGEMALVFKTALKLAEVQLMKRKFAATDRPGHSRASADRRHIPAAVKRAVAERDREQCSFVSDSGKRCEERRFLEYDHEIPVARGGGSTVENVWLLCRAHNQHVAERAFGADFMSDKRAAARARPKAASTSFAATAERTQPWNAPPVPASAAP